MHAFALCISPTICNICIYSLLVHIRESTCTTKEMFFPQMHTNDTRRSTCFLPLLLLCPFTFFFFYRQIFFPFFFITSRAFVFYHSVLYGILSWWKLLFFFMRAHCLSQSNRVKNKKKDQRQRLLYVMADISRHRWACIPHCADFNGNVGTTFFPSSLLV